MKTFSIREAINFGWDKVWQNIGLIFLVVLVNIAINFAFGFVGEFAERGSLLGGAIVSVLSIIVSTIMSIGIMKIYLKIHDGIPTGIDELFAHSHLFWRYIGVSILMMIIVGIGLIFLIIPGIYLALRFYFVSFLVVDKEVGVFDAFKQSEELTEGIKGKLALLMVALLGVNILGLLALGVGLFITVPLSAIAIIHVYRSLLASKNTAPVSESQTVIVA